VSGKIIPETEAGIWYNTFDQIVSTINLFDILPADISGWKTYTNMQYGFEIKYPEDFIEEKNLFSTNFGLIFCPSSLTEYRPDNSIGCKIKSALKGDYEGGIYLFTYNDNNILNKDEYYYLGKNSLDNKYYYLFLHDSLSQYKNIAEKMVSTFKFTK
jgi:hypothetical protein